MKTLFWLFTDYREARTAVRTLLDNGFDLEKMNAIMTDSAAKDVTGINWKAAAVQVSGEVGDEELQGLDRMLAGERPVTTPDAGEILAAGELATITANSASSPGDDVHGLHAALVDIGVTPDAARDFVDGLAGGGLLLWLRTEDERAGEARSLLRDETRALSSTYTV